MMVEMKRQTEPGTPKPETATNEKRQETVPWRQSTPKKLATDEKIAADTAKKD